MITFWKEKDGKLIEQSQTESQTGQNQWIDTRSVTREDIRILEKEFGVEQEHIIDILDQDELSRIEQSVA
ncbi:MAG: magnesium transporter CorA family protein, partial [Spirochaetales bacterium]